MSTDLPHRHGRWSLLSRSRLFVRVQCDCGTVRTIRRSTWRAGRHLTKMCRVCRIKLETKRNGLFFLKST